MIIVKVRTPLGLKKVFGGGELEFSFKEEISIKALLEEMKK